MLACPKCNSETGLRTSHTVSVKSQCARTIRMRCEDCNGVFTSIQFVHCEVRRNGHGHMAMARLLESGEARVFLDVAPPPPLAVGDQTPVD